ncbi:UNKNOWN [Stylonychia lemnae]|uniref:Uncharacterized protein n=1 Tax=Stylonychia lemnae TaxID=5949 RepID=A0A078B8I6_STYLE|nr:UNKNOWN [Stylonychia lemnae]|eukprot:CDW90719.1 UNKNOWN [Stylonychia lemnae]
MDDQAAKGLRVTNMISIAVVLVLIIIMGVLYTLFELFLAIYILEIIMVILNIGYLFLPSVHAAFNRLKAFLIYLPCLLMLILTTVEFFRLFVSWIRYPGSYNVGTQIVCLITLVTEFAHNFTYALYARKCAAV